jgi:hypothetical protein
MTAERTFPIQMVHGGYSSVRIPWSVAERAYAAYLARFYGGRADAGAQTLERLAERGGFGPGEMDMLAPGWRADAGSDGAEIDLSALCCRVQHCKECKPYRTAGSVVTVGRP